MQRDCWNSFEGCIILLDKIGVGGFHDFHLCSNHHGSFIGVDTLCVITDCVYKRCNFSLNF